MATEQITVRLSDQDPIEAEIIKMLRSTIRGRKSHLVREIFVCGYQALAGNSNFKPGARYVPASSALSVSDHVESDAFPASKTLEAGSNLNTTEAANVEGTVEQAETRRKTQPVSSVPAGSVDSEAVKPAETAVKASSAGGAQALKALTGY